MHTLYVPAHPASTLVHVLARSALNSMLSDALPSWMKQPGGRSVVLCSMSTAAFNGSPSLAAAARQSSWEAIARMPRVAAHRFRTETSFPHVAHRFTRLASRSGVTIPLDVQTLETEPTSSLQSGATGNPPLPNVHTTGLRFGAWVPSSQAHSL